MEIARVSTQGMLFLTFSGLLLFLRIFLNLFRKCSQAKAEAKLKPYTEELKAVPNRGSQKPKRVNLNLESDIRTLTLPDDPSQFPNIRTKSSMRASKKTMKTRFEINSKIKQKIFEIQIFEI